MPEEPKSLRTPEIDRAANPDPRESEERRRMNQIANEAAEKVTNTEKEQEREHSVPATGPGGIS
jgi:hypothetical protein